MNKVLSKHNIVSKIADSENYLLVNLLYNSADILLPDFYQMYLDYSQGKQISETFETELLEKNYLVDPETEQKFYKKEYLKFIDQRDEDEVQLFFVTNYSCNFACSYCFQDEYVNPTLPLSTSVIDAFFDYVASKFSDRRKYITLFGGEPLMNGNSHKENITYFVKKAKEANIDISVVTNGYHLSEYIDILKLAHVREVQITLDGTEEIHNKRRFLKGGGKSFTKIVEGVDLCLQQNIPINLRMVLDKDNISELPKLAAFAIEKGWTKSPIFKTQLGRNYELHHCQSENQKLYSRIDLYKDIYELLKTNKHILEFHKPAFSISRFLWDNSSLPTPLFDACPACKNEWAFDYAGKIYSCTATVGKSEELLGEFYPIISEDKERIKQWENRDLLTISKCGTCSLQLACGGGCGSVAKNQFGDVNTPDCRPLDSLMGMGFATYFE